MSRNVPPIAVPSQGLLALARKYRTLAAMRRAKAQGEPDPTRGVFKTLADEFPGALNELDMLPLDEIDARADALERAAASEAEPWMAWLSSYHALMRAALRVKMRLARRREVEPERADELARDASAHAGTTVGQLFVRAIARPPRGRIGDVVFAEIAVRHGVDEEEVRDALFPYRRARRKPSKGTLGS